MARHSPSPADFKPIADKAPEYVDVILWHRVALVAGGVMALLAATVFVLYHFLKSAPAERQPEAPLQVSAPQTDQVTARDATTGAGSTADAAPAKTPTSTAASDPADQASNPTSTPDPTQPGTTQASANTQPIAAANHHPATPAATPKADPAPAAVTSTTATVSSTAPAVSSTAPAATAADTAARFTVRTEILSPVIKRALITDIMRGREPGAALTSTQSVSQQGSFGLFQFVEIHGRAGDTLTYIWKRNGTRYARVNIAVGGDKWRNFSSKNFNRNLMGDWQVEVIDSKGILLVHSRFYLGE